MRRLSLIRHAVTAWNTEGRIQGHLDCALSEEGVEQARALGQRVGASEVDVLYASPLQRSYQTAKVAFPSSEVNSDPRLMELNFGVFQGKTPQENAETPEWREWMEDPFRNRVPGGESYADLMARAVDWLEGLPPVPHIVAITHSGTIQMILAHVMGVSHPRWRKRVALRHTSITRLVYRQDEVLIERVNDTRHVRSDLDPFLD